MKQPADAAREHAVEVRFGQVGIMQVRLRTTQPGEILDELTGKTATAPHFFDRTPVCLDLSSLSKTPSAEDIRGVIEVVKRAGMMTVGLVHGGTAIEELANQLELPVIHHVRASTKTAPVVQAAPSPTGATALATPGSTTPPSTTSASATPASGLAGSAPGIANRAGASVHGGASAHAGGSAYAGASTPAGAGGNGAPIVVAASAGVARAQAGASSAAPPPAPEPTPPALMQHQPVRSGQRVYARNRDLIVTAPVAAGAEVMADGCVHVYGPLRGRVMAGAHGDTDARVFCQSFHAELVSIAGVFRVFETIPSELAGMPVQAWLSGDDLKFAKIGE